jgi:hypothetical protein
MKGRLILSLCDLTGNWPSFYKQAGYEVRLVDLSHGQDVRLLTFPEGPVHGILAAPPCTVFSRAGAWVKREPQELLDALAVVDACLRFVAVCRPTWWALENPVGTLRRWLGPPAMYFDPCDYGDPYTKRTCLWGNFTVPGSLFTTTRAVPPSEGSKMHRLPGASRHDRPEAAARKRAARSATPIGFAKAFFEANP